MTQFTCAVAVGTSVFVGASDGRVRCYDASQTDATGDKAEAVDLAKQSARWTREASAEAITCICAIPDLRAVEKRVLLVVGTANGALVFYRDDLEIRRLQLEGAVMSLAHAREDEFLAGDLLGSIYGVSPYEILWKDEALQPEQTHVSGQPVDTEPFFYASCAQPFVNVMAVVNVLDIEKTLSRYAVVSMGQKQLIVTHKSNVFAVMPTQAPITTLSSASFQSRKPTETSSDNGVKMKGASESEDLILAAGEEGIVYRIVSSRDINATDKPRLQFALEMWAEVPFPIAKILLVPSDGSQDETMWACVGVLGQIALFRGKQVVQQWTIDTASSMAVDIAFVTREDTKKQYIVVVAPERIRLINVQTV